jgi:hypothetical protein
MRVRFFTVRATHIASRVSILQSAFGPNTPIPMPWEGGPPGVRYLFCVKENIPFQEICKRHNWDIVGEATIYDIDEYTYTSTSEVSIRYGKEPNEYLKSLNAD